MTNSIKGLEAYEGQTREYNRQMGRLKMKAGVGLIDALESWYFQWQEKPTPRATREYLSWRLRLHLKFNNQPEFLEELEEFFNIGLRDETPGPTYWEVEQPPVQARSPFNWRRQSGDALRGGKRAAEEADVQDDLEEQND